MKALVFGVDAGFTPPATADGDGNPLLAGLAHVPMALQDVPDPVLPAPDWVVLRPRLTGICGSDAKQVFMDMGGDATDFSMTAFISFPQVLGHEVVADVVEVGPAADGVTVGDRVVLQCWLSCAPAGSSPCARRARPATTSCVGTSPRAAWRRASTPGTPATPPAGSPSSSLRTAPR